MAKKIPFFIINIKLQNDQNQEERTLRYRELISRLSRDRKILEIKNKNAAIIMYSSYGDSSSPYIYGQIAKGVHIAGEEIDVIKEGGQSKELNDPKSIKLPNSARYIFVPAAHRLCIEKVAKGPTPIEVEKYINEFLAKYLNEGEILEVLLEKDEKTIEEIFEAKAVYEVSYKISYTNEDIGSEMDTLFDQELKRSNIGQIEIKAKADNKIEGLKVEGTPILEGGLKIAKSNGEVTRAVIIPEGRRRRKTISNDSKPKLIEIEEDDSLSFWVIWYNKIMGLYRSNA